MRISRGRRITDGIGCLTAVANRNDMADGARLKGRLILIIEG